MMITLTLVKAGQNETRPAQKDLRRQVLKPTVEEMWNFYCFQLRDNALQKNKKKRKTSVLYLIKLLSVSDCLFIVFFLWYTAGSTFIVGQWLDIEVHCCKMNGDDCLTLAWWLYFNRVIVLGGARVPQNLGCVPNFYLVLCWNCQKYKNFVWCASCFTLWIRTSIVGRCCQPWLNFAVLGLVLCTSAEVAYLIEAKR